METARIEIDLSAWTDEIGDHLERACVHAARAQLQAQAESGAKCFAIRTGGQLVGAYLLRVDDLIGGPEGVIVAASGHVDGVELLDAVYPHIEQQLRAAGCHTVRLHTSRPGIARMMGARGFDTVELVLTKAIK